MKLTADDLLVLASLHLVGDHATADEVACQHNHILPDRPRRRAQGVAQTLLRLERLELVEVDGGRLFGCNAYKPVR